jgi:dTDP-4-amino-4,6-dideoxygalactose transaminase
MEGIMALANKHNVYVIEDNAQAIGADYTFSNGKKQKSGTIGHIGCTSFFPSKNLGCYGDGGAIITNDKGLADKIAMIANHGQAQKYHHSVIGVNSRLDSIQAAILNIKIKHLDEYIAARQEVAAKYDEAFAGISELQTPVRQRNSTHVFHQYTLRVTGGKREALKSYLESKKIPCMIYYPIPLYKQAAFSEFYHGTPMPVTEVHCEEVLSLPIHTEMKLEVQTYIIETVKGFFS